MNKTKNRGKTGKHMKSCTVKRSEMFTLVGKKNSKDGDGGKRAERCLARTELGQEPAAGRTGVARHMAR